MSIDPFKTETRCSEASNRRRTFDRDADGVVHGAQLVLGRTAVIPSVRLGYIHDAERLLEVQERLPLRREVAAHFAPGNFRGWTGFKESAVTRSDNDT